MNKKGPAIDSVNVLLEECIMAFPVSSFVISLYKHYLKYGTLSRKQLQGLHAKASGIEGIAPGKLAAVEAIIKRMPVRNKFAPPVPKPLYEEDKESSEMINSLLALYPSHKRVLFLQTRLNNSVPLSVQEKDELKRLMRVLIKK